MVNVALGPGAAVGPAGDTVAMPEPKQVSDSLNVPVYPKALTEID